jgi:hypothetical protein
MEVARSIVKLGYSRDKHGVQPMLAEALMVPAVKPATTEWEKVDQHTQSSQVHNQPDRAGYDGRESGRDHVFCHAGRGYRDQGGQYQERAGIGRRGFCILPSPRLTRMSHSPCRWRSLCALVQRSRK